MLGGVEKAEQGRVRVELCRSAGRSFKPSPFPSPILPHLRSPWGR